MNRFCWVTGSQSQEDYVQYVAERPVIKKLVDNMVVNAGGQLLAQSIQHRDFPNFHPKRPVINRLTDNLKIEGSQPVFHSNYIHCLAHLIDFFFIFFFNFFIVLYFISLYFTWFDLIYSLFDYLFDLIDLLFYHHFLKI